MQLALLAIPVAIGFVSEARSKTTSGVMSAPELRRPYALRKMTLPW